MNVLNLYIRESYDVVTHGEMYPQCPSQIFNPKTSMDIREKLLKRTPEGVEQWRLFKEKMLENENEASTIIGKVLK